jgi:hypothetical protein
MNTTLTKAAPAARRPFLDRLTWLSAEVLNTVLALAMALNVVGLTVMGVPATGTAGDVIGTALSALSLVIVVSFGTARELVKKSAK